MNQKAIIAEHVHRIIKNMYVQEYQRPKKENVIILARRSSRLKKKSIQISVISNKTKKITAKKKKPKKTVSNKKTTNQKEKDQRMELEEENGVDIEIEEQSQTFESEEAFRYWEAHLYANKIISQNAVESLLNDLQEMKMCEGSMSRTTICRTVVEAGIMCQHVIAELLPFGEELTVSIDESPKHNGRSFVGILLIMFLKENVHWYCKEEGHYSFCIGFVECAGKTAKDLANMITTALAKFKDLQEQAKINKKISVLDIHAICADFTASNSGSLNGLIKTIDEMKKELDNNASPTLFSGCNDHLTSLSSKHFVTTTLVKCLNKFGIESPIPHAISLMRHVSGLGKKEFNGFSLSNFKKKK
jgi:hypothetical protein